MGSLIKTLFFCVLVALFFANFGDKIAAVIKNEISYARDSAPRQISPSANITNSIEIPIQNDGHYWVKMNVNNRPIDFVVDTGASYVTLSHKDAEKLNLSLSKSDYNIDFRTAAGITSMAEITIDTLSIGVIEVYDVKAYVAREGMLSVSLLGMNFLNGLQSFEFRGQELVFSQ